MSIIETNKSNEKIRFTEIVFDFKVIETPELRDYKGPEEGGHIVVQASYNCNLHAIMKEPEGYSQDELKIIAIKAWQVFKCQEISPDNLKVYEKFAKLNPEKEKYITRIVAEPNKKVSYQATWGYSFGKENMLIEVDDVMHKVFI